MEFTKPEPTPANPLGALVVCHEDHSMTIVDEEAAEVAFTRRPLGRIFIATPLPPSLWARRHKRFVVIGEARMPVGGRGAYAGLRGSAASKRSG